MSEQPQTGAPAPEPIRALFASLPKDVPTVLDPTYAPHQAAIEAALAAAGRDQARYPLLHASTFVADEPDHVAVIDKGADSKGRATALVAHAAKGETLFQGGTTFAFDGDNGTLLGLGHNSEVQTGFNAVSTDTPTAKPAGSLLNVLSLHHSVTPDQQVRYTALASSTPVSAAEGSYEYSVQAPTQTPKNPAYVLIAVGRMKGWNNIDADYIYYEDQINQPDPYLIVPFVGTCTLPYQIDGTVGQSIPYASFSSVIYFVTSQTYTVPLYTSQATLAANTTLKDAYTVSWSFPYDSLPQNQTKSLVYNPQSLVNEKISYFSFTFTVPIVSPPGPKSFSVCSVGTPNEPTMQCFKVPNVEFSWHCLAKGTKVALAGGGAMPIEDLNNSHRVVGNREYGTLGVEGTKYGRHAGRRGLTGPNGVYRLVVEGGYELIGTGLHTVLTPDGLVPLESLRRGASVITERGKLPVASCETIDHSDTFFNLTLGNAEDHDKGLPADAVCHYVANGIYVGDHDAMHRESRKIALDVNHPRSHVARAAVTDYASAVSDIRY